MRWWNRRPMRRGHWWNRGRRRVAMALVTAVAAGLFLSTGGDQSIHAVAAQPSPPDLTTATIAELQAALTAGTVTSRDLVTMYRARIAAYDQQGPALNAISVLNPNALAEADALDAERRAQGPRGPLHGIPVVVKDNYDTADMQTAAGSLTLMGWMPPDDAFLVQRLRAAGAIIVAKTNMHEFAYGITSVGSLFGQVRNPYAPDHNPGGSSGGTGAAIAAAFAAVGLGSDTCGSIRIPSSHNSLVGLRGTQGLLSRTGIIPLSHTQDIGGPLGRTVADVAVTLDALVGYDPADAQTAASVGHTPKSYTEFLQADGLRGARIGILTNLFVQAPEDSEVAGVVRAAIEEMRLRGAMVTEVSIPGLEELLNGLPESPFPGFLVLAEDFKFDLDDYLAQHPTAPVRSLVEINASGKVDPAVLPIMQRSAAVETRDNPDYWRGLMERTTLQEKIYQALADSQLDVLAYPTIRRKAARIGEQQAGSNCGLSAKSGMPAIAVPGGFTEDRLPVGVELLGRPWSEGMLIKLAYGYEQATHHRRPPTSTPPLPPDAR